MHCFIFSWANYKVQWSFKPQTMTSEALHFSRLHSNFTACQKLLFFFTFPVALFYHSITNQLSLIFPFLDTGWWLSSFSRSKLILSHENDPLWRTCVFVFVQCIMIIIIMFTHSRGRFDLLFVSTPASF